MKTRKSTSSEYHKVQFLQYVQTTYNKKKTVEQMDTEYKQFLFVVYISVNILHNLL